MKPNQILLTFPDKATADFVRNRVAGKGHCLEDYIVDNMDWDSGLYCEEDGFTSEDCKMCEFADVCERDDIGESSKDGME